MGLETESFIYNNAKKHICFLAYNFDPNFSVLSANTFSFNRQFYIDFKHWEYIMAVSWRTCKSFVNILDIDVWNLVGRNDLLLLSWWQSVSRSSGGNTDSINSKGFFLFCNLLLGCKFWSPLDYWTFYA